jgi:hypothetical protein
MLCPQRRIWAYTSVRLSFSPVRVCACADFLAIGHLSTNPLQTKAATSGILSALQEFLASYIAGEKSPSGSYVTSRVPKMAFYGVLPFRTEYTNSKAVISAPLGHGTLHSVLRCRD